jgi:hypothetical protein
MMYQYTSITRFTLWTSGGRFRSGEILEGNNGRIDIQSILRVGDSLVPWIFMFNRTHLSNLTGDLTKWPVYITIGNASSKICQMPTRHSVRMVSLLLIPIKTSTIHLEWLDQRRLTNRAVLIEVLQCVLQSTAT